MSSTRTYPGDTCPKCGYNLTGLTRDLCPECGEPFSLETYQRDFATKRRRHRNRLLLMTHVAPIAMVILVAITPNSWGRHFFIGSLLFIVLLALFVTAFVCILASSALIAIPMMESTTSQERGRFSALTMLPCIALTILLIVAQSILICVEVMIAIAICSLVKGPF